MVCCLCGTSISEKSAHIPLKLGDSDLRCCRDCADKIQRTGPCVCFLNDLNAERFINPLDETTIHDVKKRF